MRFVALDDLQGGLQSLHYAVGKGLAGVPIASIIADVFASGGYAEAEEDLNWWSTSDGRHLKSLPIRVKAMKTGKSVKALLIPINS